MADGATPLLLVSNPDDGKRIAALLAGEGIKGARWGDGGDDTLTLFEELEPPVVILAATLDRGDARTLAAAMRGGPHGGRVKIVLVGERHGPVRNALDAVDFAVDRFVGQPLSAKALAFAVRSCLAGPRVAPPPRAASGLAERAHVVAAARALPATPPPSAGLGERLSLATDHAVDDFLRDAMALLPSVAAVPAAAPEEPTHKVAAPARPAPPPSLDELWADPPSDPPWREPTLILSDGGLAAPAQRVAAGPAAELPRAEVVAAPVAAPLVLPLEEPPLALAATQARRLDEIRAVVPAAAADLGGADALPLGSFARELRRKMSLMAERLFPGQGAGSAGPVDVGVPHDPHTEIDLTAIGGEAAASLAEDPGTYVEVGDADTFAETDPRVLPLLVGAAERAAGAVEGGERGDGAAAGAGNGDARDAETGEGSGVGTTRRRRASSPPSLRGEIDRGDVDVATLIARLYRDRFTGRVLFRRPAVEKSIHLDEGRPVFATSNLPHDRMGDLLYREGKITRDQHARSRELVVESGRRMGEILVEMGFLKRRELLPAVRRHLEDIIYSLFSWTTGEYLAVAGECAPGEKIRLSRHPAALVIEGIRRKYDLETVERRLGSSAAVLAPRSREAVLGVLTDVDLSAAERQLVEQLDGERSLGEATAAAGADVLSAWQLAFGLVALGVVDVVRAAESAPVREEPVRPPALVGATDLAIDRQRLLAKHAHVVEADYFTLLGVRRDASAFEIRRAYEAARRDYAAESFPGEVRRELAGEIEEIGLLLDEAYQVLRSDRVRASYLTHLRD